MTSDDVIRLLRTRYAAPAWALVEQVGNATGYGTSRHADALAMGLWPSRGLELLGFEVKVSRSDWTRELKNPEKAEPIAAYCDRWYIVAPAGIVPVSDIPPNWGLLEAKGSKLFETKPAERLTAKPLDRSFVAAILRRTMEQAPDVKAREEIRSEIYATFQSEVNHSAKERAQRSFDALEELRQRVSAFEAETGISLEYPIGWPRPNGKKIGETVNLVLSGQFDQLLGQVTSIERTAHRIIVEAQNLRRDLTE